MPDPVRHNPLPEQLRLHTAAVFYFLSRFAVVAFVFALPGIYLLRGHVDLSVVAGAAGLVTTLFISYYLAAAGLRCAACNNPALMDNGSRRHLHAQRFASLNPRARVAWDILFHTNYQCMYCGARCGCKKGWGAAKSERGAKPSPRDFGRNVPAELFPQSPFSNVEGLSDEVIGVGPLTEAEESSLLGETGNGEDLRFGQASVIAGESRSPVSILAPGPVAPAAQSVRIASMSPVENAVGAGASPPAFAASKPASPVPWTFPSPAETPANDIAMNRQPIETHQPAQGSNPFLAAAAAMPPPSSPVLPTLPRPVPEPAEAPSFHQEFPRSGASVPDSGSPPPWTLPSMPLQGSQSAVMLPVPPEPDSPSVSVKVPAAAPSPALQADLLKHVIATLEDGRRVLTGAFQSLIGRLEASFAAACSAPVPAAAPVPAPVISQRVALPSLLARPEPVAPLLEKTALVPPPPVAVSASPPAQDLAAREAPQAAAPRRRFARPSGRAAQELSSALNQVFEPVPPASSGNGYASSGFNPAPATTIPSPRAAAPESPFQPVPAISIPPAAPRTPAAPAETAFSPFAVSSVPLATPDGMSGAPEPFTFLNSNADYFQPDQDSVPAGTYDPLDDTALPWMQPLAAPADRN